MPRPCKACACNTRFIRGTAWWCPHCGTLFSIEETGIPHLLPPQITGQLLALVVAMRNEQRAYYRTKDQAHLIAAKRLERDVDAALDHYHRPELEDPTGQGTLFGA